MKPTLLFWMLLLCSLTTYAQYDSAVMYKSSTISFSEAADTLINRMRATAPYDTLEGGDAYAMERWKGFMGVSHIAVDPLDTNIIYL